MASVQDVSIRQLQYVVAVADTLGFHRAAERCHVSQPTLSSQLQKLEELLGVRIFERDRRRVLVTRAGEPIVLHARRVLVEMDDLLRAATTVKDPFAGTIRIGVIPTVAPYLLPMVMPAVNAKWTGLRLALVEEKTGDLVTSLRNGALDAGLLADVPEMGDLERVAVMVDPFVVALPHEHRLAKKKNVSIDDIEDETVLLLDEGHCLRTQALALCQRAVAREADLRATSLGTLVQMVSAGAGVTLLPSMAVAVENRRGQLAIRPLAGREQGRTICLAWRKASPLATPLKAIAKVMRAAGADKAA